MSVTVTITFTSDHPAAMMIDWAGEVAPILQRVRDLGVMKLHVEVENLAPPDPPTADAG